MTKVNVPYYAIVGYIIFVVVASLLVGLLPPFVNRPACKETARSPLLIKDEHILIKRDLPEEPELIVKQQPVLKHERLALREKARVQAERNPQFEALVARQRAVITLPTCAEVNNTNPSMPWNKKRLPGDIQPVSYDITWTIGAMEDKFYTGEQIVMISLNSNTQYFMLNSRLKAAEITDFKDINGNNIQLACSFVKDEYFVFKTSALVAVSAGPVRLEMIFSNSLDKFESGLFRVYFGETEKSSLIQTKFEPIDAREAFPCFDEPTYKATFKFRVAHPTATTSLSNMDAESTNPSGSGQLTVFKTTPKMPSYMMSFVIFKDADFKSVMKTTDGGKPVKLWTRNIFIDNGFASEPLEMSVHIFNQLVTEIFPTVPNGIPEKIDIFCSPEYPNDAIPHFGLPIFKENAILFKNDSASERDQQNVAFLIAKQFAEFWFGNLVTFSWWNELWLQEALSDFIKYEVLDVTYPEWLVKDQFVVEEMIYALVNDGYPSSHPIEKDVDDFYELEGYFDLVESSKVAAILRMIEFELPGGALIGALTTYLKNNEFGTGHYQDFVSVIGTIRKWPAADFFDRWIKQANYPQLTISVDYVSAESSYYLNVYQERHVNSPNSIYGNLTIYPSPWNNTWFLPLSCRFGNTSHESEPFRRSFDVDVKMFRTMINNPPHGIGWYHCDLDFTGYYVIDYPTENWDYLAKALEAENPAFGELDRANIIHNVFVNGFSELDDYRLVVNVLNYLRFEEDYLPWRTIYKHLNDMIEVLQYKKAFNEVSKFFSFEVDRFDVDDLYKADGTHIETLQKETIIQIGNMVQSNKFLQKASSLWPVAIQEIIPGNFNETLPPFVRDSVYNFHLQNTYDVGDWNIMFRLYEGVIDQIEERRYLEALTYSKLPWLLATFLEFFENELIRQLDFFDVIKQLSRNPLGREIAWDYVRIHQSELIEKYGFEDPRLGQMIIDISWTFENEFLLGELIQYIFFTPGGASEEAFFQSLETVSANVQWLKDKEQNIIEAFGGERKAQLPVKASRINLSDEHRSMLEQIYQRYNSKKF